MLGQYSVQEQDVRHDLESMVVEVVFGRPHRIVPERLAVLGIRDEVSVGTPVVILAVTPLVRWWPIDAGIWHVYGPVEECTKMHLSLQCPGAGEQYGPCPHVCKHWEM